MTSELFRALDERFDDVEECRDIARHGCEGGVSGFIYYHEINEFFWQHRYEIEDYLSSIYGDDYLEQMSKGKLSLNTLLCEMVWVVVTDHCMCVAGKADELLNKDPVPWC